MSQRTHCIDHSGSGTKSMSAAIGRTDRSNSPEGPTTTRVALSCSRRSVVRDIVCCTSLVLIASVPLIALRDSPLLGSRLILILIGAAAAVVALGWLVCGRTRSCTAAPRPWSWSPIVAAAALAGLTLVAFYVPQCQHFWGGFDEFVAYAPHDVRFWSVRFDAGHNRPLTGLTHLIGHALAGGRIEGFLWLAALLCWGNALLLWGILRRVL